MQQVVTGYFNYHAVLTNRPTLTAFLFHVTNLWRRTLQWRSQKDWTTWERTKLVDQWLPQPRILIRGPISASPLDTQVGAVCPNWGRYGMRGARGNSRPYRERQMLRLSSSNFDDDYQLLSETGGHMTLARGV